MAEGDGTIFVNFKEQVMEGVFDLSSGSDVLKVALVTGWTPDINNHSNWTDASNSEESGTGYTAGGASLAGQDVTQDDASDRGVFDATDVTWTGLDVGTPSHAVLYDVTAGSLLIAAWEITTASNGGDYVLQFGEPGLILLT